MAIDDKLTRIREDVSRECQLNVTEEVLNAAIASIPFAGAAMRFSCGTSS